MWLVWCPLKLIWKMSWISEVSLIYPFYLLWISNMMCRIAQYLPWGQCLAKNLQYLQPVVTLWICVLISDAIIRREFSFLTFFFVVLTIPSLLPKIHIFSMRYVVISLRYVRCLWKKMCKTLYEKGRCFLNSLTWYWKTIGRTILVPIVRYIT